MQSGDDGACSRTTVFSSLSMAFNRVSVSGIPIASCKFGKKPSTSSGLHHSGFNCQIVLLPKGRWWHWLAHGPDQKSLIERHDSVPKLLSGKSMLHPNSLTLLYRFSRRTAMTTAAQRGYPTRIFHILCCVLFSARYLPTILWSLAGRFGHECAGNRIYPYNSDDNPAYFVRRSWLVFLTSSEIASSH